MELREILSRCDHTLLRVDATAAEIRALCDQGMRYGCASVCIPPCHVAGAKKYVGDRLRICTVIGFPNGYHTPAVKAFEAAEAIRNGADEVDMVVNLAMVKDGCWDDVAADIRAVREVSRVHACTDVTGFGLLGHSYEMASGSGVTVRLHGAALPLLPQAEELADMGIVPGGAYRNRDYVKPHLRVLDGAQRARLDLAADPQTSGGLLVSLPRADAEELLEKLHAFAPWSAIVGEVLPQGESALEFD